MKKLLASAAILAAFTQPAAANDAQIFGAIAGAVIGYHLMERSNTLEVQPQIVITAPHRHYQPQTVIVVQQPQHHYRHGIHPQTARIYSDTCTAYGQGRHGNVICR